MDGMIFLQTRKIQGPQALYEIISALRRSAPEDYVFLDSAAGIKKNHKKIREIREIRAKN